MASGDLDGHTGLTRRRFLGGLAATATASTLGATLGLPGVAAAASPSFVGLPTHEIGPGGWCWFQGERIAVDPTWGRAWFGSAQCLTPGATAPVHVTAAGLGPDLPVLSRRVVGSCFGDDHASPGLLVTDPGRMPLYGWASHRREDWLEVGRLGSRPTRLTLPNKAGSGVAYARFHQVGRQWWMLTRAEDWQWCLLTADRPEGPWRWRGKLLTSLPSRARAVHRPYLQAASDGRRLHVAVSDAHPMEGWGVGVSAFVVHPSMEITDTAGRPIGVVGTRPPNRRTMTRIVDGMAGSLVNDRNVLDHAFWPCQAMIDRLGRFRVVLSERRPPTGDVDHGAAGPMAGTGAFDHRIWIASTTTRGTWNAEPIAWCGGALSFNQSDYSGLASLHPNDSLRVVVSSNVDPTTNVPLVSAADGLAHWELWEGTRFTNIGDPLAKWRWQPITQDSAEDHLRPVIATGGGHGVLGWMQGRYGTYENFDTRIVARYAPSG